MTRSTITRLLVLAYVVFLCSTAGLAATPSPAVDPVTVGVLVDGSSLLAETALASDTTARDDRLLLDPGTGSAPVAIFASKGRAIEDVLVGDLDGQGDAEIVVRLGTGGSGGFRDVVVLARHEGAYRPIYDEGGFKAARVILEDRDGKEGLEVVISQMAPPGPGGKLPTWTSTVLKMDSAKLSPVAPPLSPAPPATGTK